MKKLYMAIALIAVAGLLMLGCTSPAQDAQTMFDNGQFEALIAKYGDNADLADLVNKAKEAHARQLYEDGEYEVVLEKYPDAEAAKAARNALAQKLFDEGKFDELIANYGDTPAAMKAKLEMEMAKSDSLTEVAGEKGKELKEAQETIEAAAARELQRIKQIKNPRLRKKAMEEFINNSKYKSTKAAQEAKKEMG